MDDDILAEAARQRAFEDEICARILAQAQVLRRDLAQRAWLAGIAPIDFLALRYMMRSTFRVSPRELSRALACSASNVTKILKRLSGGGYIAVSSDRFAPKAKSIGLTAAGREAYARAHARHDPIQRFNRLSYDDCKELYRLLGLLGPRRSEDLAVG